MDNRFNQRPRGRHNRGPHMKPHRGRPQRPLLTSAITASGLCLVALMQIDLATMGKLHELLGYAVMAFAAAAFLSYFAQRVKGRWLEKVSDLFFLGGVFLIFCVVLTKMGILV